MEGILGKLLSNSVPARDLVLQPDHPFLLRGPDALVGGNGNLCAIFTPHFEEDQNPAHLASRLIASRLALPPNCRTLLILGQDQKNSMEGLTSEFGLTTVIYDRAVTRFLFDSSDFGQSRPVDIDVQEDASRQFDNALSATERAYRTARVLRKQEGSRPIGEEISSRGQQTAITSGSFRYEPQNRTSSERKSLSVLRSRNRNGIMRQLRRSLSGNFLDSFVLDSGVPYRKDKKSHLVVIEAAGEKIGLRSKAVYGAAFSGTTIIPTNNIMVIEHITNIRERLHYSDSGIIYT